MTLTLCSVAKMRARWLQYRVEVLQLPTQTDEPRQVYVEEFTLPGNVSRIVAYHISSSIYPAIAAVDLNKGRDFQSPLFRAHLEFNEGHERINEVARPDWNYYNDAIGSWVLGLKVCERPTSIDICSPNLRVLIQDFLGWDILQVTGGYEAVINLLTV